MDESEESKPEQFTQTLDVDSELDALTDAQPGMGVAGISSLLGIIAGLQNGDFGDSLGIGTSFFENIAGLASASFGEGLGLGLDGIGASFENIAGLASVNFRDSLGASFFENIAGLASASFGEGLGLGLDGIGASFENIAGLASVNFSDSLGASFFENIAGLSSPSFGEGLGLGLDGIGASFENIAGLTSVNLRDSLGIGASFFEGITGLQNENSGLSGLDMSPISSVFPAIGLLIEASQPSFRSALDAVDRVDRAVQSTLKGVIASAPRDTLADAIAAFDRVDYAAEQAAAPLVPPSLEVERFEVAERVETAFFAPRRRKRDDLARLVELAERRDARDIARDAQDSVRFWVQVDLALLAMVVGVLTVVLRP